MSVDKNDAILDDLLHRRDVAEEERQTWLDEVDQDDDVDPVDAEADEYEDFNED